MAEFERDLISERTKGALSHLRAKGELAGTLPFGKALAADGKSIIDNPAELEAIAAMRRWRVEGLSWRAIADRLTEMKVPTRRGAGRWSFGSVRAILEPLRDRNAKGHRKEPAGGDTTPPPRAH